ncbi:hypothetical protein D3C87_2107680 [compost metagenome]
MKIYARLNDTGSVDKQYQLMIRMLEQEEENDPRRDILEWYAQWKQPDKSVFNH